MSITQTSDSFNAILTQLITQGQSEGLYPQMIVQSVQIALGLPVASSDPSTIWDENGVSRPNERGLYRDRELEEFKAQLVAAGSPAAEKIKTWIASHPGAMMVTDPIIRLEVETNVSYAGFTMFDPAEAGNCFEYDIQPTALGPRPVIRRKNFIAVAVPDAMAAPITCQTFAQVRAHFKQRVLDFIRSNNLPVDPKVDFSPARP